MLYYYAHLFILDPARKKWSQIIEFCQIGAGLLKYVLLSCAFIYFRSCAFFLFQKVVTVLSDRCGFAKICFIIMRVYLF